MIFDIIIWFITGVTLYQLLVALINLFWNEKLPRTGYPLKDRRVSVLIPARNEETNITCLLDDLLKVSYPPFEIIICDDHSTDNTAALVDRYSRQYPCIKWFRSEPLPPGWAGKNFACFQLAQKASGDYFLFLDADIRIGTHAIERALSFAEENHLGLLSVFPKQIMKSFGEKITVPIMNFALLTLLPLIFVRKVMIFSSFSAANGQFMFFRSDLYRSIDPHLKAQGNPVEDIYIARLFKKAKIRIACLTGDHDIRCRMYKDLKGALNGFAKNIRAFFFDSYFFTILFWFVSTFGFVFVWGLGSLALFILFVFVLAFIRIAVSLASCQPVICNIVLAPLQQFCFGWIIYKSISARFRKQLLWKGRSI